MLVLSRKPQQAIVIGGNITVQVVRIEGQRVVLALDAPKETPIWRGELREGDTDGPAVNGR